MERAVLIGISKPGTPEKEIEYEWVEFTELARTAGALEMGRISQSRETPDPALFFGAGKAELLKETVRENTADLVISRQELSAVQVRNLEDLTGVRVIDRTDLILDIFAGRAQTKEGKLQVELAQLNYILPRLGNTGFKFSRLGGGIGTRGPGETKLEVDRRRVKKRISALRRELTEVETRRMVQRRRREKNEVITISLVGYTNAGKSTLFNRLTESSVSAEGRLFDTLDPVMRQVRLPNNRQVVFLDTVGFISNLPPRLVAAFKATLEETVRSTICLHVMDGGVPDLTGQYGAVRRILENLRIPAQKTINVLNKIDLLDSENTRQRLAKEWAAVPVSARTGQGIDALIGVIVENISCSLKTCRIFLPFSEAGLLNFLHQNGLVLEELFTEDGVKIKVQLDQTLIRKYQRFLIGEGI